MRILTTTTFKIALILGVVTLLGVAWVQAGSVGSTFATNNGTGGIEMKIDNKTFYNGVLMPKLSWALKNLEPWCDWFFNFGDVKPGDTGTTTMSIHIKQNPAYVCLDFKNFEEKENGINEPEGHEDNDNTGELGEELEFFAWRDDGDNAFEVGELPLFGTSSQKAIDVLKGKSYPLADATTGGAYQPGQTKYIGITWCAGNLSVDVATAKISCDHSVMGNEAQTDSMKLDVRLRAVASKQQPGFRCDGVVVPPPPPTEECEIEGHKYDQNGSPLAGWTIGLGKIIKHNKGSDVYDLATDVTDQNGYYCLEWDGEKRTPRNTPSYKSGPYTFTYHVFEKMQNGWQVHSIEKGPTVPDLAVVPSGAIKTEGVYVYTQIGEQNGVIYGNAAYHVDFYNRLKTANTWTQVDRRNGLSGLTDYLKDRLAVVSNRR